MVTNSMRSRLTGLLAVVVVLSGCPKNTPEADLQAADAGNVAEQAGARVDAIEREVAVVVAALDEGLWALWLHGTAFDADAAWKGHEALLTRSTLEVLREARAVRPDETERLGNLERWLVGQALTRGVRDESDAFANLEATATFVVDGRELPFRDLNKLLLSEKSAVKRRALWSAALTTARRLDAALERREQKLAEVLQSLGYASPLEAAAALRGLDSRALEAKALELLAASDAEWASTLERLAQQDVKLPVAQLSRADLPRLLKVPAVVDAEFPKERVVERASAGLADGGVQLDVSADPKKNPLPLTVEPTPGDVRVSLKPTGGLRDQLVVLGELATAQALWARRDLPFARSRLEKPEVVQKAASLATAQLEDPAWLEAQGVQHRDEVVATARALRLFALRRAAGVVLAGVGTAGLADEADARANYVAVMGRALGMPLREEEGARWRLETFDFLRSATTLGE